MDDSTKKKFSKEDIKKYMVFTLMFIAFLGCMWLIFAPSQSDKEKQKEGGLNSSVPDPTPNEIVDNKIDAYQQAQYQQKQQERILSLEDFSALLDNNNQVNTVYDENLSENNQIDQNSQPINEKKSQINNSVSAYNDMNRNLNTFYTPPAYNSEKDDLKNEIQELKERLDKQETQANSMDEHLVLMEKSYELAAKYFPNNPASQNPYENQASQHMSANDVKEKFKKANGKESKKKISNIQPASNTLVSALDQYLDNDELFHLYDQPRNFGFHSVENGTKNEVQKNTILACIHGDQVVMDGQSINLRLMEDIQVDNTFIPKNTILTAFVRLQGERLNINVSSLEYKGKIINVDLAGYDTDGQKGIYIPGSMELDALKEVAANMGSSVSSGLTVSSVSSDAKAQIASDITKGLIQGSSQYFSKKVKMVKVNLKSEHKILLHYKE